MNDITTTQWLRDLHAAQQSTVADKPNYWRADPRSLISESNIPGLVFGTGSSIFDSIQPAIESTEHELIIVTCFWAPSVSLDILRSSLLKLSAKGVSTGRRIRVRICFSSLSLFQKLFHTSSPYGQVYAPATWESKFGLPLPGELQGLDLEIKTIFVRPFSVMHPKFVVVDRRRAFLPSCNVSWEDWFEGCVELHGGIVRHFVKFWEDFWAPRNFLQDIDSRISDGRASDPVSVPQDDNDDSLPETRIVNLQSVPTIFLPSPHHVNPRFQFLPWRAANPAPATPLNTFVLSVFAHAERRIYIQTPNLTAPPVLSAVLRALQRGVDIHVVTSERLMVLEQLVTAGTTTARCVRQLIRRYVRLRDARSAPLAAQARSMEDGRAGGLGRLLVEYYQPRRGMTDGRPEPVQSHLKLTISDDRLVILGSGNMDRASWYTSQELGVAFFSDELAAGVRSTLKEMLYSRTQVAFDSMTDAITS